MSNWKSRYYWQLMRFDKPIGIALLWYPVAWALWLSTKGQVPLSLLLVFFAGTVVMRAAGCVVNDIADRDIDKHVQRTKDRPLTSGRLRVKQALICLFGLLGIALGLLWFLPAACLPWAVFALITTIFYPLCKRFFATPQLILGIAFSLAIPMVYAAVSQGLYPIGLLLLVLNLLWVFFYDTQYAMVDRRDDTHLGVFSSALFLGHWDFMVLCILFLTIQLLWLGIAYESGLSLVFYLFWMAANVNLCYQLYLIKDRYPPLCFRAFLQNAVYGLLMWLALIFSY